MPSKTAKAMATVPKLAPAFKAATGQTHVLRIMKDLREFYGENPSSMHVVADDKDVTTIHALIRGPEKTPYHNGFFYFVFRFPMTYPLHPPTVKLITTGGGTVSFNPNLYSCGKVCLSILGTWSGPAWSPCQTLFTTMLSIQSLLNENPYYNEPGYENMTGDEQYKNWSENYNKMIAYETLRVAVIDMLDANGIDSRTMPQELKDVMISYFRQNYKFYEDMIQARVGTDDRPQAVANPSLAGLDLLGFRFRRTSYQYNELLVKLQNLKTYYSNCDSDSTAESGQSCSKQAEDGQISVESYRKVATDLIAMVPISKGKETNEEGSWDDIDWDDSDAELDPYEEEEDEGDAKEGDEEVEEGEIIEDEIIEDEEEEEVVSVVESEETSAEERELFERDKAKEDSKRDEEVDHYVDVLLDQMIAD